MRNNNFQKRGDVVGMRREFNKPERGNSMLGRVAYWIAILAACELVILWAVMVWKAEVWLWHLIGK